MAILQPAPLRVPLLDREGQLTESWRRFFLSTQGIIDQILNGQIQLTPQGVVHPFPLEDPPDENVWMMPPIIQGPPAPIGQPGSGGSSPVMSLEGDSGGTDESFLIIPIPSTSLIQRVVTKLTDAQIKALPTTGITIVPAATAGLRSRVIAISTYLAASAGGYTNINTTYADLHVEDSAANYVSYGPTNDNTTTPVLARCTAMFATGNRIYDWQQPVCDGNGVSPGYVLANTFYDPTAQQSALTIKMANGASGNLTGGNAANTLEVSVYYALETV